MDTPSPRVNYYIVSNKSGDKLIELYIALKMELLKVELVNLNVVVS